MRTVACLLLAALHAFFAAVLTPPVFEPGTSLIGRFGHAVAALVLWAAATVLVARPFLRLPQGVVGAFQVGCFAVPALYFVASLDRGMISGQEFVLGLVVTGFSFLSWKIFDWAKASPRQAQESEVTN